MFENQTFPETKLIKTGSANPNITVLNCTSFYSQVLNTFNSSIWNGINLFSEYNSTFGGSYCFNNTLTPTPSTLTPSTIIPSTITPSTVSPSVTMGAPTTGSATSQPSTSVQSSTGASTNIASSSPSISNQQNTVSPTTSLSTSEPTNAASTSIDSSSAPSTQFASNNSCFYQVSNCEKCSTNAIQVDQSQFNISCTEVSGQWVYSFKNKFSNSFEITRDLILNTNDTTIIEGNFNQSSNTTIVIVVSFQNKNQYILDVSGCVSLNGEIDLQFDERPSSDGNYSLQLISYNCSQKINISDSQIKLTPNYKDSKCDSIKQQINNQQNSLSISISSTLNKNCKGKKTKQKKKNK